MDVDLIFKIAAVGILVAVLNQLLIRSGREAVSYTHLDVYKRQSMDSAGA